MARFVLQVQDIDDAGRDYHFSLDPEWLGETLQDCSLLPDPAGELGHAQLRAQRDGANILVTGRLVASLSTECGRCLGPAPVPVSTGITALFTARAPEMRPAPDEVDLTPEDLDRNCYSGSTIELDDLIREQLILELPMQPLCSEDCSGIRLPDNVRAPADNFATDRPMDPRLAPLKALADKLDNKE